jgi:hypothetical protein
MDCPTCGGEGYVNQLTEHDVSGKPFEISDGCDLSLGSTLKSHKAHLACVLKLGPPTW